MFVIIAAALAVLQPSSQHTAPPDARSCLGEADISNDLTSYQRLKSKLSAVDLAEACRQAREANLRRQSLARVLRQTAASPIPGFRSVTSLLESARKAKHPDVAQLFNLAADDQLARASLSTFKSPIVQGLSPPARELYDQLVARDAVMADARSREWLRATVARRGWFTISRDGEDADAAAQLIVQHSDEDLAFKGEMIALIEPLVEKGESRRSFFPYMYDRWAAAVGKPLRFGFQGACKGKGVWEPLPIQDPEHLDERRRLYGVPRSFADEVKANAARCP